MASFKSQTKEQLVALAISKGVKEEELDGLSKAEIVGLLEDLEGTDTEVKAEGEKVDSLEDFDGDKIHVHEKLNDVSSAYLRTYSEEEHGEDFLALAKSFASKKSNRYFVK